METNRTILFSQASLDKVGVSVGFHTHPGVELIMVSRGRCRIAVGKSVFDCTPGTLLVIPPESPHNQIAEDGELVNSFVVFLCPPEVFDYSCRLLDISGDEWCIRLFRFVCEMSEALRYELCGGVLESLLNAITGMEAKQRGRRELHPALGKALDLMEREFAHPWSMEELSARTGVSHTYLRKLFTLNFQLAPLHYLQNLRMAHARKMLLNSYLPVTEVAEKCGYADGNYFSRLFRKVHRCTPNEYRRIMRERPENSFIRM